MYQRIITMTVLSIFISAVAFAGYFIIKQTHSAPTIIYLSSSDKGDQTDQSDKSDQTESSANQPQKTSAAQKPIEKEADSTLWSGEWNRNIKFAQGILKIKDVTDFAFSFELTAYNGANIGELTGNATITGDVAVGEIEGECIVRFKKNKGTITLKQNQACNNWAGNGVTFEGDYENGSAKEVEQTLEGFIFDTVEQDARFRKLVGEDYKLFTDNFMAAGDYDDLDGFGAKVKGGFIQGLATTNFGMIMINDTYMWAVVTDLTDDSKIVLKYYTDDPNYKQKLPKTIKDYIKGRYEDILYQSK